jgi:nucleoside 2-deoxyribosyltransferase
MMMLEAQGIDVTSTWLRAADQLDNASARLDLADLARADVFVAWNPDDWVDSGTGGRHVEFGYALALKKPIVLVGERSNIFHFLDGVTTVDDLEHLVATITQAIAAATA